jgi:AcrR family transcriptional regulator
VSDPGRPRRPARARQPHERKRQPTEIRRQLVVEAARDVIGAQGLFSTTMRDIALASNVSLGTITYHFTGLDEILAEVLQREMEEFYAPVVEGAGKIADARAALGELVDGFLAPDERTRRHWLLWLEFWALAAYHPVYSRWLAAVYAGWRRDITAIVKRGVADGTFRPVDVAAAVVDFMAALDGLVVQTYLPDAVLTPAMARERLSANSDRLLARTESPSSEPGSDLGE